MSTFPLFTQHVPMIGRSAIYRRIVDGLIKATPQPLSLVGPKYSGKSVILSHLGHDPTVLAPYTCVVPWDLGHQIPQSDAEFIEIMRGKLSNALAGKLDDISNHLAKPDAGYPEILESIEYLDAEKKRVLMVWDAVDLTVGSGTLTRNLWDNLLALGRKKGFVLVLSSRRRLQELIRDADSVTSEFWQLFEVVPIEPMVQSDLDAFAVQMSGFDFLPGSVTELMNWTCGIPPLVVSLMNEIGDSVPAGPVTSATVNSVAAQSNEQRSDILEEIWSALPAPVTDLYRGLLTAGPETFSNLPKKERVMLQQSGLLNNSAGVARAACRLMQEHCGGSGSQFGALANMFGTWEKYCENIRGILERRLAQIEGADEQLCHMVERAIEDLPRHANTSLNSLSHIEDRAFDVIWQRECGAERLLSAEVIAYWTEHPRDEHRVVAKIIEADSAGRTDAWEIPTDRTPQLALLQLLTGSHQDFRIKTAKFTSKDTYVLMNAIHSFRNRSQHSGGEAVELGVAVSAVMLCVELLACLSHEDSR